MDRWGTDKPDLRFGMEFVDLTDLLQTADFRIFQDTRESGGRIRGIVAPGGAELSRKELDELTGIARAAGAAGALYVKRGADGFSGGFAKALDDRLAEQLIERAGIAAGDLLVVLVGRFRGTHDVSPIPGAEVALDTLRRHLASRLRLRDASVHSWLWVTDFPMFERDEDEGRWTAVHHPFTRPAPGSEELVRSDPGAAKALAYDMVVNGIEIGGGSFRIHEPDLQAAVFDTLGLEAEEQRAKFGFLLDALAMGAPPHGGIAFGIERMLMALLHEQNLRDVIAFPKSQSGSDPLTGSPAPVDESQLRELGLALTVDPSEVRQGERPGEQED